MCDQDVKIVYFPLTMGIVENKVRRLLRPVHDPEPLGSYASLKTVRHQIFSRVMVGITYVSYGIFLPARGGFQVPMAEHSPTEEGE